MRYEMPSSPHGGEGRGEEGMTGKNRGRETVTRAFMWGKPGIEPGVELGLTM